MREPSGSLRSGHKPSEAFWSCATRTWTVLDASRSLHPQRSKICIGLASIGKRDQTAEARMGPTRRVSGVHRYLAAFEILRSGGFVYPCACSRQVVLRALQAPHDEEDEPVYPGTCRPVSGQRTPDFARALPAVTVQGPSASALRDLRGLRVNWRFRVPDGEVVTFADCHYGPQRFVAGKDFGDFVVWRHDDVSSYQLAVVVDDAAMKITEVVRGEDLLRSTARQLLLYRALGLEPPRFCHCPLLTDSSGCRLAKRHDSLSLRTLRNQGQRPEELRSNWQDTDFVCSRLN